MNSSRYSFVLSRINAAREALEVGDYDLVDAIMRDLEDDLEAEDQRWVNVFEGSLVADMSVFTEKDAA